MRKRLDFAFSASTYVWLSWVDPHERERDWWTPPHYEAYLLDSFKILVYETDCCWSALFRIHILKTSLVDFAGICGSLPSETLPTSFFPLDLSEIELLDSFPACVPLLSSLLRDSVGYLLLFGSLCETLLDPSPLALFCFS